MTRALLTLLTLLPALCFAQAAAPSNTPSALMSAYTMSLFAPQGLVPSQCLLQGGSDATGICIGGYPGASQNGIYVGVRPDLRTSANAAIRSNGSYLVLNTPSASGTLYFRRGETNGWVWDGVTLRPESDAVFDIGNASVRIRDGWFSRTVSSSAGAGVNGFALTTNGARFDFGGGADDYLFSDGFRAKTGPAGLHIVGATVAEGEITHPAAGAGVAIGDVDGLEFKAATPAIVRSSTTAVEATATVPAFKVLPLNALDADDLILDVQNSAGASRLKVDAEGDVTAAGAFSAGSVTANGFSAGSGGISITGTGGTLNNAVASEPLAVSDAEGLRLSSTAALPTCAAALEGTMKRDGTTGAASTARTRVCVCTSDGAVTPAYVWQNIVSATLGTATTCAP